MERLARVASLWNWLPAFRAVAETEHLMRAAKLMRVSPSALSRSIHLLEDAVGEPLFVRQGRGLKLTAAGEALLDSVREGMRRVDNAMAPVDGSAPRGPLRIAACCPAAEMMLGRVLAQVRSRAPELVPHVCGPGARDEISMLLSGCLDLAIVSDPRVRAPLVAERLGDLENDVYCAATHPLARSAAGIDEILAHPFAVPRWGTSEVPSDGWPAELRRTAGAFVCDVRYAIDMLATGTLLAVLPVAIAPPHLVRLHTRAVPTTPIYAIRRASCPTTGPTAMVLDAWRDELERDRSPTLSVRLMQPQATV